MKTLYALLAVLLVPVGVAHASDPVGVYAIVGKVVLEPDETSPTQIRICGTFSRAIALSSGKYSSPEDGYLYYKCKAGEEAACRMQWQDIQKAMNKGACIGFGSRYPDGTNGRVRTTTPPQDPDVYATGIGVVMMPSSATDSQDACRSLMGRTTMHAACNTETSPPKPDPSPGSDPPSPPASKGCSFSAAAASPWNAAFLAFCAAGLCLRRRRGR